MEHLEVQKVETVRIGHMHVSFHPRDFDPILSSEKDPATRVSAGWAHQVLPSDM